MKGNEFSSSSEQLCALLDGELNTSEATPLFYELAQNTELQEEFRDYIAIRTMFAGGVVSPPDHIRRNILITTGLGIGGGTLANSGLNSNASRFISFLGGKPFLMTLSAFLATLATYFIVHTSNPSLQIMAKTPQTILQNAQDITDAKDLSSIITTKRKPIRRNIPLVSSNSNLNNYSSPQIVNNESKPEIIERQDNKAISYNPPNAEIVLSQFVNRLYPANRIENNNEPSCKDFAGFKPIPSEDENYQRFSIQIRKFIASSIPQFDMAPLDKPALNDISIGLFYQLNPNISVGMEFGQENFLQKYYWINGNITDYVLQNYLGFWGGLAAQYTFDEFQGAPGLQAYLRLFSGGTSVGPIFKPNMGLNYTYADKLTLYAGLEPSLLIYRFRGNTFTTLKLGFSYGIGFKF